MPRQDTDWLREALGMPPRPGTIDPPAAAPAPQTGDTMAVNPDREAPGLRDVLGMQTKPARGLARAGQRFSAGTSTSDQMSQSGSESTNRSRSGFLPSEAVSDMKIDEQLASQQYQEKAAESIAAEARARADQAAKARQAGEAREAAAAAAEAQQTQRADKARQEVERISSMEVEPDRVWENKSALGKIFSALEIFVSGLGGYMLGDNKNNALQSLEKAMAADTRAQIDNKNSQLSYWSQELGSAEAAKAAADLKRWQGVEQILKSDQIRADSEAEAARKNELLAGAQMKIAQRMTDLEKLRYGTLSEQQARQQTASQTAGVQQSQQQSDSFAPPKPIGVGKSLTQLEKELTAKLNIQEMAETGRTPQRNEKIRQETAQLTDKLEPTLDLDNALNRVYAAGGITRDERGNLVAPDDIPGKGVWDAAAGKPLLVPDWDQKRVAMDAALANAKDVLGRMRSGGAITEEELETFSSVLDATTEASFMTRLQQFDQFVRQKAQDIQSRASDDAKQEFWRRRARQRQQPSVAKPVTGVIGQTKTSPREQRRQEAKQILGGQVDGP